MHTRHCVRSISLCNFSSCSFCCHRLQKKSRMTFNLMDSPQHPDTWFMVGDFGIRITKHDAYNWILNTRCKCEHFHVNSFLGSNWKRWNRMRLHEITGYCICRITASALTNEEKKFFIRNNFAGNTFEVGILWKLFPTVLLSDTN